MDEYENNASAADETPVSSNADPLAEHMPHTEETAQQSAPAQNYYQGESAAQQSAPIQNESKADNEHNAYDPFAEKSFKQAYTPPPPPPPVSGNYGGYYQEQRSGYIPYGAQSVRYSGAGPMQMQYGQQFPPPPPPPMYSSYMGGAPAPAAAADGSGGKKKLSIGATVGIALVIAILFMILMVLLAVSAKDESSGNTAEPSHDSNFSVSENENAENSGTGNTIVLPVKPKPVQESKYYEDESTGYLTVTGVAKTLMPSVVDVEIYGETSFYPDARASGIIISDNGYIVTNAHVVSSVGTGIKVTLSDKREFSAKIIGKDSRTDLAVIKIEADDLTPAELGDSSQIEIGEQVVAIGNSGGFSGTLTVGYVSGIERELDVSSQSSTIECIQTDAALSPGVSGGALINMYGQVIGITTMKHQTSDLDEGLGFAISINFARPIIEDIISRGYISGRVRVGIYYTVITAEEAEYYGIARGILVNEIAEDCDISNTELKPGDIITKLNGKDVYSSETIEQALKDCSPGDVITAHIYRKGITADDTKEFDIEFKLMQDTDLS